MYSHPKITLLNSMVAKFLCGNTCDWIYEFSKTPNVWWADWMMMGGLTKGMCIENRKPDKSVILVCHPSYLFFQLHQITPFNIHEDFLAVPKEFRWTRRCFFLMRETDNEPNIRRVLRKIYERSNDGLSGKSLSLMIIQQVL